MRNNLLQLITKVRKRIRIHIFIRNELLISNLCIIYDHFIHDRAIESIFFLNSLRSLSLQELQDGSKVNLNHYTVP